jgi:hypothetical protein
MHIIVRHPSPVVWVEPMVSGLGLWMFDQPTKAEGLDVLSVDFYP